MAKHWQAHEIDRASHVGKNENIAASFLFKVSGLEHFTEVIHANITLSVILLPSCVHSLFFFFCTKISKTFVRFVLNWNRIIFIVFRLS